MSTSFFGNFFREKFPFKSNINREENSTGAKLFNAIGTEIENKYRRKMFSKNTCQYISNELPLNTLSQLHTYDLTESENYKQNILGQDVNEVLLGDLVSVRSLEELYNSLPYSFEYQEVIDDQPLILTLENLSFSNDKKQFHDDTYIYVNVKKVSKASFRSSEDTTSITIRGKDKNFHPIEETILIDCEAMYQTKQKFFSIEKLKQDANASIQGGPSISVSGLTEYSIDILKYPINSPIDFEDTRIESDEIAYKKRRILIPSYVSKPKPNEIVLENSLDDNDLVVELVTYTEDQVNKSKLRFIHRYFKNVNEYRSEKNFEDVDENIFEEIMFESFLYDSENNHINALSIQYSITDGNLYILDDTGKLNIYELGIKEMPSHQIVRTYDAGLRIDSLQEYYLKDETVNVRLVTTNLDFPIKSFFVGKLEGESFSFLSETKDSWQDSIHLFSSISTSDDLQDSLGVFTFEVDMQSTDCEIFVATLVANQKNFNAINSYNLNGNENGIHDLLRSMDLININSKYLISSYLNPIQSYKLVEVPEIISALTNSYFKGNDRSHYLVTGTQHFRYKPTYQKFFYSDHTIYSTYELSGDLIFKLYNNSSVTVSLP